MILELVPASNEGCFLGVSVDEGCMVGETLAERIVEEIRKKTGRVRNGTRAKRSDRWWLVFDDEILIAPIKVLDVSERARIAAEIGVVAPLWLRAKSAYGGGRGMFEHEVSQALPVQAREAEEVPRSQLGANTTKGCAAGAI